MYFVHTKYILYLNVVSFTLQHTAANLTSSGQQPQPEAPAAATTSASVTSTASNQSDTMFNNNPELEPVTA